MSQEIPRDRAQESQELSEEERMILRVLIEEGGPLDVIGISGRTRLSIDRVIAALEYLRERDLVEHVEPEPAHERFAPSPPAAETLQNA